MAVARQAGSATELNLESQSVPSARTRVIGREAELLLIIELLQRDGVRVVTITGAAGAGKSTVAEEAARRIAANNAMFVHKYVVPRDTGPVGAVSAMATLTGAGSDVDPQPIPVRGARDRVVLLDGIETTDNIRAAASAALDAHPNLVVLATGIQPLDLRGEHVVHLEPLVLPAPGERDPVRAGAAPAFRLFCERLAAAAPGFELTADRTETIVSLCRLLDGLPLALELAAARCAAMPLDTVADLLSRESLLAVLTSREVDGEQRHQSLRATIAWSCELLDPRQRQLLASLGVFAGPFTLGAGRAVAADRWHPDWRSDALLVGDLYALVACGFLKPAPTVGVDTTERFVLPAGIREFTLELFAEPDRIERLRRLHAAHYRGVAVAVASRRSEFGARARAQALVAEQENMIAALDWDAVHGETHDALAFALALTPLWIATGATGVGVRTIDHLVDRALHACNYELHDPMIIEAAAHAGELAAWSRVRYVESVLERLRAATDAARALGRVDLLLDTLYATTQLLIVSGANAKARAVADEAVELCGQRGDYYYLARFLSWRAVAENNAGDHSSALDDAITSLNMSRAGGDEYQVLLTTHVLANVPGASETTSAALPAPDEMIAMARRLGDVRAEGLLRIGFAMRAVAADDTAAAGRHIGAVLALARCTDLWYLEGLSVFSLVFAGVRAGFYEDAVRLHGALHDEQDEIRSRLTSGAVAAYDAATAFAESRLGSERFDRIASGGHLLRWRETLQAGDALARAMANDAASEEGAPTTPRPSSGLTTRELDVLRLLASGSTNKEIAAALRIRPKTVTYHASNIYRKLGTRTRTEAVTAAWRQGLLASPSP